MGEIENRTGKKSFGRKADKEKEIVMSKHSVLGYLLLVGLAAMALMPAVASAGYWDRIFDHQGLDDQAVGVATGGGGNAYVLATCSTATGNKDVVVVKYDQNGNQLGNPWVYNSGGDDEAVDIAVDGLHNVLYVVAYANQNYCTIALNALTPGSNPLPGWPQWYDGGGDDNPVDIALGPNGAWVVVTGTSWGGETGKDYLTVSYLSTGDEHWPAARYDRGVANPGYDRTDDAFGVAVDGAGDVYVTGTSSNPPDVIEWNYDYCTVKYDGNTGQERWVAIRDDSEYDEAYDVEASGLCIYVTGIKGDEDTDVLTIRYTIEGTEAATAVYGIADDDEEPVEISIDEQGYAHLLVALRGFVWVDGSIWLHVTCCQTRSFLLAEGVRFLA